MGLIESTCTALPGLQTRRPPWSSPPPRAWRKLLATSLKGERRRAERRDEEGSGAERRDEEGSGAELSGGMRRGAERSGAEG